MQIAKLETRLGYSMGALQKIKIIITGYKMHICNQKADNGYRFQYLQIRIHRVHRSTLTKGLPSSGRSSENLRYDIIPLSLDFVNSQELACITNTSTAFSSRK